MNSAHGEIEYRIVLSKGKTKYDMSQNVSSGFHVDIDSKGRKRFIYKGIAMT